MAEREHSPTPVRRHRGDYVPTLEAESAPLTQQKIGKTVVVTRMVKPAYDCGKCGQPKRGHVCPGRHWPDTATPSPPPSAVSDSV